MSLADQIINHEPWPTGELAELHSTGEELNALRDELIAARTGRENRERFTVESGSHYRDGIGIWLVHGCGNITEVEPPRITLAELVQRAGEHTEVCNG